MVRWRTLPHCAQNLRRGRRGKNWTRKRAGTKERKTETRLGAKPQELAPGYLSAPQPGFCRQ